MLTSCIALLPLLAPAQDLLLRQGNVLAADGEGWLRDTDVLIHAGRIAAIGRDLVDADSVEKIDVAGRFVIPGLIDLHSHLLLHPYDEASWNDQVLRESLELRTVRGVAAMRATLEAGFTTLRELGTEGAAYADVALREAVREEIVPGPRIFAATRALVATGCYGPSGFDPRWDVPKGAQVADGVDGLRTAVREQVAHGADWIKVYADYRRKPGDASTPTYSLEELETIVEEARSAGLEVASHAVTDEAIRRSVQAGVATIEHGTNASLETLRSMREHGVVLCPTLAASEAISRYGGWEVGDTEPPRVRASRELIGRALEAGVTIACGSDVGVFPHGDNARELELLVRYGLSPTEALRSATETAARVLGKEGELGRIAPNHLADLVVLSADPLGNPSAVRSVELVLFEGRLAYQHR